MSVTRQAQNSTQTPKTKWDEAIADAEAKIKKLKLAIETFEDHKRAGDVWPETVLSNG
jgi:AAA+ superfamily predicted ATPase